MPGQPLGSFVEAAASAAANRLHTTSTALLTTTGLLLLVLFLAWSRRNSAWACWLVTAVHNARSRSFASTPALRGQHAATKPHVPHAAPAAPMQVSIQACCCGMPGCQHLASTDTTQSGAPDQVLEPPAAAKPSSPAGNNTTKLVPSATATAAAPRASTLTRRRSTLTKVSTAAQPGADNTPSAALLNRGVGTTVQLQSSTNTHGYGYGPPSFFQPGPEHMLRPQHQAPVLHSTRYAASDTTSIDSNDSTRATCPAPAQQQSARDARVQEAQPDNTHGAGLARTFPRFVSSGQYFQRRQQQQQQPKQQQPTVPRDTHDAGNGGSSSTSEGSLSSVKATINTRRARQPKGTFTFHPAAAPAAAGSTARVSAWLDGCCSAENTPLAHAAARNVAAAPAAAPALAAPAAAPALAVPRGGTPAAKLSPMLIAQHILFYSSSPDAAAEPAAPPAAPSSSAAAAEADAVDRWYEASVGSNGSSSSSSPGRRTPAALDDSPIKGLLAQQGQPISDAALVAAAHPAPAAADTGAQGAVMKGAQQLQQQDEQGVPEGAAHQEAASLLPAPSAAVAALCARSPPPGRHQHCDGHQHYQQQQHEGATGRSTSVEAGAHVAATVWLLPAASSAAAALCAQSPPPSAHVHHHQQPPKQGSTSAGYRYTMHAGSTPGRSSRRQQLEVGAADAAPHSVLPPPSHTDTKQQLLLTGSISDPDDVGQQQDKPRRKAVSFAPLPPSKNVWLQQLRQMSPESKAKFFKRLQSVGRKVWVLWRRQRKHEEGQQQHEEDGQQQGMKRGRQSAAATAAAAAAAAAPGSVEDDEPASPYKRVSSPQCSSSSSC